MTWRQFTEALEAMRTRGTSNPADSPVLDEARKRPPPSLRRDERRLRLVQAYKREDEGTKFGWAGSRGRSKTRVRSLVEPIATGRGI